MEKNREYYEENINSSDLFKLDPQKDVSRYKVEAEKLKINLYNYLICINKSVYENLAVEILETANYCIKAYKPEYGLFLNYFNAAMAKSRKKAERDEIINTRTGGAGVSEQTRREFREYATLERAVRENESLDDAIERYAEAKGIDYDRVRKKLADYESSKVISVFEAGNDGEEINIIDRYLHCEEDCGDMEEHDAVDFIIGAIDETFCSEQERNRCKISTLIIYNLLDELQIDEYILTATRRCEFFDEDIYIDLCENKLRLKDIAARFGVKESSLSRSWANFCRKVKERMTW